MTTTIQPDQAPRAEVSAPRSILDPAILRAAILPSFAKLDPRVQIRNPVMFVVEIGAAITTVAWLIQAFGGGPLGGGNEPWWFTFTVSVWLWLTVVFANFAEALAEGRGKAQAAAPPGDPYRHHGADAGRRPPARVRAPSRGRGRGRGRRDDPQRRDGRRGHRLGRRVGHHGRVSAGHPRGGR